VSMRFRKSIKLAPGVRLNVGKKGVGVSAGVRGARISANTSGRRTVSASIPGTGLGYQRSLGGRRKSPNLQAVAPVAPMNSLPLPLQIPKPGLFAPDYEKEFHKGILKFLAEDLDAARLHFRASAEKDSGNRMLSDDFLAGLLSYQLDDLPSAIFYLERVVQSDQLLPDQLMTKYIPTGGIEIGVTEGVTIEVPFGTACAILTLVEGYQRADRTEEAIGLLQRFLAVAEHPALVLSLVELFAEDGDWDEVIELASGYAIEDDTTFGIRLFQAQALEAQGVDDAALEVYKDCLRSKKRNPELLREARYRRGKLYIRSGKKAQGRKDLGAVVAEDPAYKDARQELEAAAS
jgi:tetratricopeptide (TPR) repeat protein